MSSSRRCLLAALAVCAALCIATPRTAFADSFEYHPVWYFASGSSTPTFPYGFLRYNHYILETSYNSVPSSSGSYTSRSISQSSCYVSSISGSSLSSITLVFRVNGVLTSDSPFTFVAPQFFYSFTSFSGSTPNTMLLGSGYSGFSFPALYVRYSDGSVERIYQSTSDGMYHPNGLVTYVYLCYDSPTQSVAGSSGDRWGVLFEPYLVVMGSSGLSASTISEQTVELVNSTTSQTQAITDVTESQTQALTDATESQTQALTDASESQTETLMDTSGGGAILDIVPSFDSFVSDNVPVLGSLDSSFVDSVTAFANDGNYNRQIRFPGLYVPLPSGTITLLPAQFVNFSGNGIFAFYFENLRTPVSLLIAVTWGLGLLRSIKRDIFEIEDSITALPYRGSSDGTVTFVEDLTL